MDNEYYDYEDRRYINPAVSRDEQLGFVDKLRNSQNKELDKISRDTYNLGTHIPSNMGGLSGSGGVWAKQYVTPQTNSMLESLKSTAQAQALNDAMTNYQNQLKKRYNDAYKAAAKRRGGGGGGGATGGTGDVNGDVEYRNSKGDLSEEFWSEPHTGSVNGTDVVNYGLYQLKRQPDWDDERWKAEAQKWYEDRYREHNHLPEGYPLTQEDWDAINGANNNSNPRASDNPWESAWWNTLLNI